MFVRRVLPRIPTTRRCVHTLSHLPTVGALPFIGSLHKLFRIKTTDGQTVSILQYPDAVYAFYKQHGPVYTLGLPGVKGVGSRSLVVVCTDPVEFVKVIQNEGRCPIGAIQQQWVFHEANKSLGTTIQDFFTQGEEWRRLRLATQKSLLSASAVNGYISGICKAAADASPAFEWNKDELTVFTNQCSFDVFCTVCFGQLMHTATGKTNNANQLFCQKSNAMVSEVFPLMLSIKERFFNKIGYASARFSKMTKNLEAVNERCSELIDEFLERRSRGELNEFELRSYMAVNLSKGEESNSSLTDQEFKEMTSLLLMTSVDTTSGILCWVLIHLALYPEVQAKVREEILSHVSQSGSSQELAEALSKGAQKVFPYLCAVIREVHRVRPALVAATSKAPVCEINLGGYQIPAGVSCRLDLFSMQNDPDIVDNPRDFRPERWLQSAVDARKGTPAEIIDHRLLREPFSAGARMCPGSRVARVEVLAVVSTLVRKFEFTLAPDQGIKTIYDIKYYQATTIRPKQMPKFIIKSL